MIYRIDATLWDVTFRFQVPAKSLSHAHELGFSKAYDAFFKEWEDNPHEGQDNGLKFIIELI